MTEYNFSNPELKVEILIVNAMQGGVAFRMDDSGGHTKDYVLLVGDVFRFTGIKVERHAAAGELQRAFTAGIEFSKGGSPSLAATNEAFKRLYQEWFQRGPIEIKEVSGGE